jgi:hypothetical protein
MVLCSGGAGTVVGYLVACCGPVRPSGLGAWRLSVALRNHTSGSRSQASSRPMVTLAYPGFADVTPVSLLNRTCVCYLEAVGNVCADAGYRDDTTFRLELDGRAGGTRSRSVALALCAEGRRELIPDIARR